MVKMNHQLAELSALLATGNPHRDEDPIDTIDVPDDPTAKVVERAAFEKAGGPKDWNLDDDGNRDALAKRASSFVAEAPFGSAVGLAKTSRTEITNGWEYRYDVNGELVGARETTQDGGPLAKRAAEATTVDLSKRASPHKIRLEKTIIDGDEWILGYDHEGENVYSRNLEDEPLEDEDDEEEEEPVELEL
jgi:hypothetical protein